MYDVRRNERHTKQAHTHTSIHVWVERRRRGGGGTKQEETSSSLLLPLPVMMVHHSAVPLLRHVRLTVTVAASCVHSTGLGALSGPRCHRVLTCTRSTRAKDTQHEGAHSLHKATQVSSYSPHDGGIPLLCPSNDDSTEMSTGG